jgi:hypothetical protein
VHELIPDTTVYDDVHGLIGLGGGPDGLTTPQWVNETRQDNTQFFDAGPIEVEFAATRDSFTSFRGDFPPAPEAVAVRVKYDLAIAEPAEAFRLQVLFRA